MSDDDTDPELLELLRQRLGISNTARHEVSRDTGVLKDAEHVYHNAIDVFPDMYGTKAAAISIHAAMQERGYSTATWSQHELHPTPAVGGGDGFSALDTANFIFTMDLLNFSFWSDRPEPGERFQVEYRGARWTGYNGLVACLRRALDGGVPITTPRFWRRSSHGVSDDELRHIFRSATAEIMPMREQRVVILREAAEVLRESFGDPDDEDEDEGDGDDVVDNDAVHTNGLLEPAVNGDTGVAPEVELAPEAVDGSEQPRELSESVLQTSVQPEEEAPPRLSVDIPVTSTNGVAVEHTIDHEAAIETEPTAAVPEEAPQVVADEPAERQTDTGRDVHGRQRLSRPDHSVVRLIERADKSAGKLVNLLAKHFPCFRDETRYDGRKVRFLKRAQIFVADLWAAFGGAGYGEFHDIDTLTMFADYRVPQMLNTLGVLSYSPALEYTIRDGKEIASGHTWEVQLRGCSIWAVELIRREIVRSHPETHVNAVLIDFFLYDLAKEKERVQDGLSLPHHRTRSIWY